MDMLLESKEEVESSGEERRREMKRGRRLSVATINVGIMTGKEREVADLMERRG